MTSYQDLLKQRDELEKQIQDARKRELMDAVAKVRDQGKSLLLRVPAIVSQTLFDHGIRIGLPELPQ